MRGGHRIHEVIHEMFDPAGAAAQVPLKTRAHHPPTKSWPITHRIVGISDTQHTLLDQVHDLGCTAQFEAGSRRAREAPCSAE